MWRKMGWVALVLAWGWLFFVPRYSFASGFTLYEAGARSSALAGAVVARADDLSAIFYNPAGLVQLPGFQVMGGFSTFIPANEVVTHIGPLSIHNKMIQNISFVPHLLASYQASDRVWLGLGLFSPFGLGIEYDSNWPGRVNIIKATLQTFSINPTIAVKVTDTLSMAAGLNVMYFSLDFKRTLPIPMLGPQTLNLSGYTWGYGLNLGLHYKPSDFLSMGVSYRSQVKQKVDGRATFTPFSRLDADASGSIILPDMIFAGIMVRPIKALSVEAAVFWTNWSLFKNFSIEFKNMLGTLTEAKDWHDTWRFQLGVEYKPLTWLDLRAGYAFENEPMPDRTVDYLVPTTSHRHNFCFGAGFHQRRWALDLAYTLVWIPDRTVDNSQTIGVFPSNFKNRISHAIVTSMSFRF